MNDDRDYFAPQPVQPTIYCQDVCRPGWVQPIPEPAAAPLYTPAPAEDLDQAAEDLDQADVIDLDERWTLAEALDAEAAGGA
jgi:hypothetical protein